ncbi:TonB-dependent receptor [Ancylomarina sp. 16SWW S1-10-2]|uniref:TonB-dependent receptor n=1 Tax=Ancylomarina sp. 16SWW S1-10-2 TaxID=2499681 RepID=UPI0012AD3A03|nr:TonB-dependent receptor [Ancylomarina sp. 16SWW S1-10-2]MRT91996.1 TonB-dependent receptor [Ancylomarina sp. 16SWW S1-10-2]
MYRVTLFFLFLLLGTSINAQNNLSIKGKIIDSQEQGTLPGASIILISESDSINMQGTITNEKGDFIIKARPGRYKLQVSFIGYNTIQKSITIDKQSIDLSTLKLIENSEFLQEINIIETLPPTQQRGDTTVFNPHAFKINPDATAGELLAKLPGFTEIDGKLMTEGLQITEILVDGKKFFGKNMSQALATIPSDVIKNIEVFEYQSDDAKFTGIADKEELRSVNIVTTKTNKKLLFGELASGVGKENKYGFNGNINRLSDNNSLTLIGRSKNVNAPLRLNNRRFGKSSISGNDIQDDAIGLNITASKNNKELEFSYEYGNNEYQNKNTSVKNYTSEALEGQIQNSTNNSTNGNANHNMDLRIKLNSNPKNRFLLNTTVKTTDTDSKSNSFSDTYLVSKMINSNANMKTSENEYYNLRQSLNFARKLNKKGRIISLKASINYSNNDSDGKQVSETLNEDKEVSQNINRISDSKSTNTEIRTGISYSEPIGESGSFTTGYNYTNQSRKSDKNGYNLDSATNLYNELDELTSNQFNNTTQTNSARLAYKYQTKKHKITIGSDLEINSLKSEERFPNKNNFKKDFYAIKPNARYIYKINKNKRLSLKYNSQTNIPSVSDLQEVIDVSNPLFITIGNSNLEQSRTHTLSGMYRASNAEKGTHISIHTKMVSTSNSVGRNIIVAAKDTTINNDVFLSAGGQFSKPVNLHGKYYLTSSVSYSLPIKKLKSKLNINTRGMLSHSPILINSKKSYTHTWNIRHGMILSSNISDRIDFTFSSSSKYSNSKNNRSKGSEYISQTTSLNMYWRFVKDFIFRTNASNNYQNNYSTHNQDIVWHLNLGLSSKVFKNKRGEISLTAYDLISQEDERSHIVKEMYTSDNYTNKLTNFYMLTFSYKLRDGKVKERRKSYCRDKYRG